MYQQKKWGAAVALLLLASLVSACSGQRTPSEASPAPTVTAAATQQAAADSPAPRIMKDGLGHDVTVPAQPQKLAAIAYVGDLLALGIQPAFTTDYNIQTYGAALQGVENLGGRPVNLERMVAAAPDLIITDDTGDATENEQFSKVAPTAIFPFWTTDPFEHLHKLAELLNKQPEAQAYLASYASKVKDARQRIAPKLQPGATALLLIVSGPDMGISGVRNGGYTLYRQLGFATPEPMKPLLDKDENFGFELVTLEALPGFKPDYLFVEQDDDTELSKETLRKLEDSPVWKSLDAVKQQHVYKVSNQWGLGDATSMAAQLDEILQQLDK